MYNFLISLMLALLGDGSRARQTMTICSAQVHVCDKQTVPWVTGRTTLMPVFNMTVLKEIT